MKNSTSQNAFLKVPRTLEERVVLSLANRGKEIGIIGVVLGRLLIPRISYFKGREVKVSIHHRSLRQVLLQWQLHSILRI